MHRIGASKYFHRERFYSQLFNTVTLGLIGCLRFEFQRAKIRQKRIENDFIRRFDEKKIVIKRLSRQHLECEIIP